MNWAFCAPQPFNLRVLQAKARRLQRRRETLYFKARLVARAKRGPCLDCGKVLQPCQMDLDHVRPKSFNVAEWRKHAVRDILAELRKCERVCANCHRLRTYKRSHE